MPTPAPTTAPAASDAAATPRIAIIGRIDDTASEVSAFIEQLGMEPIILGNLPGATSAISVDKLEELRGVDFAVFLPADEDSTAPTLLATGFLLAVLAKNRICFVAAAGTTPKLPLEGALSVTLDDGGFWHLPLAREMKRAGLAVDLNRLL